MTGASCAKCVEQAITAVSGVRKVRVDLAHQRVSVELETGAEAGAAKRLAAAVTAVGYEVPTVVLPLQLPSGREDRGREVFAALSRTPGVLEVTEAGRGSAFLHYWDTADTAAAVQRTLRKAGLPASATIQERESEQEAVREEAREWSGRVRWAGAGTTVVLLAVLCRRYMPGGESSVWAAVGGVVTALVLFGAGSPFYPEAWRSLSRSRLGFSLYVTLAATATFVYSAVVSVVPSGRALSPPYFETAALLVTFAVFGRWLAARSRQTGSESVRKQVDTRSQSVTLLVDGREEQHPLHRVETGDLIVANPGVRLLVDGEVVEGRSAVDESTVTGESLLAEKRPGERVISGSVNRTGRLVIRATQVRGDTVMAQIVKQFRRARSTRLPFLRTSEQYAHYGVPVMTGLVLVTFLGWLAYGPAPKLPAAVRAAAGVFIVGCPAVLGFLEALLNAAAVVRAGRLGIVVKAPEALEIAGNVSTVLLDKTGTLTLGYPEVVEVIPAASFPRGEVLTLAAAAVRHSDHPVAKAILRTATRERLNLPTAEATTFFDSETAARVAGHRVRLRRCPPGPEDDGAMPLRQLARQLAAAGKAVLLVTVDDEPAGLISVTDPPKGEAKQALEELHELGLQVAMITGDTRPVAEHLGAQLGVDRVIAEALPSEKTNETRRLQAAGELVAVVGDGFNDAPALAQADVGIAMAGGEDLTLEAAQVVLLEESPRKVAQLIRLARRMLQMTRRSAGWAFVCHGVLLPVAVGLVPRQAGLLLPPALVVAVIGLTCFPPLGYALRLRRWEAAESPAPATD